MSVEEEIVKAKLNLQNALGDRFLDYMQSMRKWFSGKTTKQEFDKEAREIVTDTNIYLHNEFLLCIIKKCNNFSSIATEVSSKTIFPILPSKNFSSKTKKKLKTTETGTKYNLRFVPVDPIKHAPSIITASIETASLASQDFTLEFCAREKSLPYAKMIHNRMLLGAIDYNLQQVDKKAVFLLAEATIWLLKNIISKLVSRSKFRQKLRSDCVYEEYKKITDDPVIKKHKRTNLKQDIKTKFEIDESIIKNLRKELNEQNFEQTQNESSLDSIDVDMKRDEYHEDLDELKMYSSDLNSKLKPYCKKLPINLYDLKNLLQSNRNLMPSHSIYTINMEKIVCNMWHSNQEEEEELEDKI